MRKTNEKNVENGVTRVLPDFIPYTQVYLAAWAFLIWVRTLPSSSRFLLALRWVPNYRRNKIKVRSNISSQALQKWETKLTPEPSQTYPSLQELQCSLILGDLEQLHGSLLVGSVTRNLLHDVADELRVLGEFLS